MNLFVTGGTGFFGKALLRYWQNTPPEFEKIYFLSRSPDRFIDKHSDLVSGLEIEFIKGNILNLSNISLERSFDVVLHAATDSTIGPSMDRLDVYQQIAKGTEEVLKFSTMHNCQRFVLTSSGGAYGAQPPNLEQIPEDYLGMPDPLDPNSAYGIGKRASEHLVTLYADKYGFDYVIARCFSFIGEDLPLNKHFAIGNFILNALNREDIVVKGDGSPVRSYLYQRDLAIILTRLLLEKAKYTAYNIGSDEEISIKSLAYLVKDLISPNSRVIIQKNEDGNCKDRYVPDISRVKEIIGRRTCIELRESIVQVKNKIGYFPGDL